MSSMSAPQAGARGKILSLLIAIAVLALTLPGAASAADTIFWTSANANSISYANLDGGGGGSLGTGLATKGAPLGMALDPSAGRVYWANNEGNRISWAYLNGSGGGNLATTGATVNGPAGMAIDPVNQKIYWTNYEGDAISWAYLTGSGGGDLATVAPILKPAGIAVDPAAGRLYWTNYEGDATTAISYANLDGSNGGSLATTGATVEKPFGLAVDPGANRVYWANRASEKGISAANLDGSGGGVDLVAESPALGGAVGIALDPAGNRIYWGNAESDSVAYAGLDGSGPSILDTTGSPVGEADFPAVLRAPLGTGAPTISGTQVVGKPQTCSKGEWAADLPSEFFYRSPTTYAYAWYRNGELLAGATESWYRPTKPGIYNCQVSAANQAGSTAQTSAELNLERGYAYANGFAPVHGRRALVTLICTGDDRCKGLVKLIAHVGYKRVVFREGRRKVIRRRALYPIGKGRFSIYPGRTKVVHVKLKRKGARLLRHRPGRRWHVRLLGRDVAHRGLMLKIPGRGRGARHLRAWHRRPG